MRELTVKKIIEFAIQIEKESNAFYENAKNFVKEEDPKKLLTQLASEEIDHQNRLLALLYEKSLQPAELNKKHNLSRDLLDRIVQTAEIKENSSTLEILKIALERENNTKDYYAMLLTSTNIDENIVEIFSDLRAQEEGHARKIKQRMEKLDS